MVPAMFLTTAPTRTLTMQRIKLPKSITCLPIHYDGEGQRVRKLVGENTRFVFGIGGQLIAEFSGSSGALLKEYIYSVSGLLATVEPTASEFQWHSIHNVGQLRLSTCDHKGGRACRQPT